MSGDAHGGEGGSGEGEGRSERRAHPLRLAQRPLVANCPVCVPRHNAVLLGAGILAGVGTVPVKTPSVVEEVFAGKDRTGRDERAPPRATAPETPAVKP
jgi:hypothetical protein